MGNPGTPTLALALDLTWLACSATQLGTAALHVVTWSTAALSAPSTASICRWRPLDLARACGGEAAPQATSEFGRRASTRVVELTERGARMAPVDLVLSHLAEEGEMRPLQGLGDPGGVDDTVEGSA
jgi:hypothetical protein